MDEINEKNEDNKKETPLSVRVDSYYKELFLELSEQPGYNRKRLLENMISSFIRKEKDENRQNSLSLDHEISLISSSLEEVFNVFRTICIKSQDTIGSSRSFYEQQVENLKKNIETLELKIMESEEERKRLVIQNKEVELNSKEVSEENKRLNEKIKNYQEELTRVKDAHSTVLNEVYNLKRIEGENFKLASDNKNLLLNIESFKDIIAKKEKEAESLIYDYEILESKKNKEIDILKSEIEGLSNQITNMRKSKEEEVKSIEMFIRKEMELKKETEILALKQEYNNLQMKYIKDIGSLNR